MLRLFLLLSCLASPVMAQSPFPPAPKLGQSSLYYLFWHIYDIELFIDGDFSFDKPFRLTLTYQRDFEGYEIAKRRFVWSYGVFVASPRVPKTRHR